MSLIGTISSQPKSIKNSRKTFESIKNQTKQLDVIYWFYPKFSKRFQIEYPEVPEWVSEYKNLKVIRCEDHGPATKIIPLLDMDIDPESKIIIFDDDSEYPNNNVELLDKNYKKNTGLGFKGSLRNYVPFVNMIYSGTAFKTNGLSLFNKVSILMCSYMVLYPRSMYPESSKEYLKDMENIEGSFLNDDLMNTYYAYKNNIDFYVIYNENIDKFQEIKQEGMLYGTNSPGIYYYKMFRRNQAAMPLYVYLFSILFISLVVYIIWKIKN